MHELELLAPAGKWDVLEAVAEAGADAVYCGDKRFNMRMLRPDFNFTREELQDAASYLHQQDKKLYVTVNNLYCDREIDELRKYLQFLQDIGVDGMIVQDLAVVALVQEMGLTVPMHASVQMGISNVQAVRFLEEQGFARAILSNSLSLAEIKDIHCGSDLTLEFFAHGDMCISHTGQCYMSSFISGASSNRGRCVKPCRWLYRLSGTSADPEEYAYHITHNDLMVYPYLRELVQAGVYSFKIEGRMREASYLTGLIAVYRQALDRLKQDPNAQPDQTEEQHLVNRRLRDLSTGSLLERPNRTSIGLDGTREFFRPTECRPLLRLKAQDYELKLMVAPAQLSLRVKITSLDQLIALQGSGVKEVIVGMDTMRQEGTLWNRYQFKVLFAQAAEQGIDIYLETPRIVTQEDLEGLEDKLRQWQDFPWKAAIANDFGAWKLAQQLGMEIEAGYGLNVTNYENASWLVKLGATRVNASLETDKDSLTALGQLGEKMEVLVQGPLCGMISDYCMACSWSDDKLEGCAIHCLEPDYGLWDACGQFYRIRTDWQCRNHIYFPHELALLTRLPGMAASGLRRLRMDGQFYAPELLRKVTDIYQQAINDLAEGQWEQEDAFAQLLELFPAGLTVRQL